MKQLTFVFLLAFLISNHSTAQNTAFPSLTADLLSGDEVTFPDFLAGKKVMITLVFEEGGDYKPALAESDNWQQFWREELKGKGIDFYNIPMMSGIYWVGSSLINGGMRKGIDENMHNKVACFYGDKMKYAEALGITDLSKCYVCLIDEKGNVVVSEMGEINDTKKTSFLNYCD